MKFPYKRVLIVGCGGAGKSTLAVAAGNKLGLPVVHLDKLWWLPDWHERDQADFDALLKEELKKPIWIIEGNYRRTFETRLDYADFCVLLDIPTEECINSVLARERMYRGRTRPDMTDGCIERVDDEFKQWITGFGSDVLPQMLNVLKNCGKPYIAFDSRKAAYDWPDGLEA